MSSQHVHTERAYPSGGQGYELERGLTKRELFAAMAMQSALSTLKTSEGDLETALKLAAKWSVRAADALLVALTDENSNVSGETR